MNIARLEDKVIVVSEAVGVPVYDFDFDLHFACTHPSCFKGEELGILRIGPIADYEAEFDRWSDLGLRLVNSPSQHRRASELEAWYPILEDLTPRTQVFQSLPPPDEIEAGFRWPVFIKGSRQTSKHDPELSIIRDRAHYERMVHRYQDDPILHWQTPVVREFVPLMPLGGQVPGKVPPSVEYRSFWWHGECVGWGRYWYQLPPYRSEDIDAGLAMAREAAQRLEVPFLVVDFAKTAGGRWIVIECNDAQESGYVSVSPYGLWRRVLDSTDTPPEDASL